MPRFIPTNDPINSAIEFCSLPIIRQCCWLFRCEEAEMNGTPIRVRAVNEKTTETVREIQQALL